MLFFNPSNWSIGLPRRATLSHSIDSGRITMNAVPISVPMIEPSPPMMIMARKMIERSMPKPSLDTT